MDDMSFFLVQKMGFVSISMKTKVAVFMKSNQINAQHSLGGMKIWPQIDLGTKLYNFAQDYDNQIPK
tara:strand:+ start:149 stop:349 length:201 start_codon:yes stop_codon:yes gene_type:complete